MFPLNRRSFVVHLLVALAACRNDPPEPSDTGVTEPPQPTEVTCDATLVRPAAGVCGVASEGTSGRLFRGTVLGDTIYRNGGVLVSDDGQIQCVGCDCETDSATVIDCPDGVVSPGLINPHDHITFANNAPHVPGTVRYDHRHEWRIGADERPRIEYNSNASSDVVSFAELRFVMSGTTSTAGAGGAAGLVRNLDTTNLEGLPVLPVDTDTFPLDDASGTLNTEGCDYGSSPTTESDIAGIHGYLPHVAEGIGLEAHNEFVCTSDNTVPGGHDLVESQTAIVHAIGMRADNFRLMQEEFASVIWSPRSNLMLYGDTARVTMIDALGVPIALGTDWMPSGSMNLLRELRCADEFNQTYLAGHFSDVDLWRMVTENAAFATGMQDVIGILAPGRVADIAIFDASERSDFRAVIGAGVEDVVLVLRGGEVLYGDAALLDEPAIGGSACEPLDVCQSAKKLCVAQDLGGSTTLASVREAGETYYPLFFCNDEIPTDEPTCVPWRPEYPDGITAADADGDGVDDGRDMCPTVFDPVRPVDEGAQADADVDGLGDACDRCPLDPGEACTAPQADDVDGDGVLNGADLCPEAADSAQADGDGDGLGDACDPCPDAVGAACALVDIATVRDPSAPGHPPLGTLVSVHGWVTAVRSDGAGFTVQDALDPFSGIFVYTSQDADVAVGNEVSVDGISDDYFGHSEITTPTVTVLDAGTSPKFAPIELDSTVLSTEATAEPYESMLVSLGAGTVTVLNADAPMDFDEFSVATTGDSDLRVNDQFFAELDNVCPIGAAFTDITGVLNYSFSNYKLEPRSDADLAFTDCDPTP